MRCHKCSKEIIKKDVEGNKIKCSKNTVLVKEKDCGELQTFVSENGEYIKGYINDDGIRCHLIHRC